MAIVKKTAIQLSLDEHETLIYAQQIWQEIKERLEDEEVLTDEVERYFDDMDNGLENILGIIDNGL